MRMEFTHGTATHWRQLNTAADRHATKALDTLKRRNDVPRLMRQYQQQAKWAEVHISRLAQCSRQYMKDNEHLMQKSVKHFYTTTREDELPR